MENERKLVPFTLASYAFVLKMKIEEAVEKRNAEHVARLNGMGKSPEEISELLDIKLADVMRFLGRS